MGTCTCTSENPCSASVFLGFCSCPLDLSFRMKAYDKFKADPAVKYPAKKVEELKLRGYFRSCMYRWKKTRSTEKWSFLCEACPKVAKSCKELPGFLRRVLGKKEKFSTRTPKGLKLDNVTSMLPPELENAVTDSIVSCPHLLDFHNCILWICYLHTCIYIYAYIHVCMYVCM